MDLYVPQGLASEQVILSPVLSLLYLPVDLLLMPLEFKLIKRLMINLNLHEAKLFLFLNLIFF